MLKGQWKRYYKKNRSKENARKAEWRRSNPEKDREYTQTYRAKNPEKYKEIVRNGYRKWVSVEENRMHKKEYQREWYRRNIHLIQERKQRMKSLSQELKTGRAKINGYDIELKQDKGGKWFYYMAQDKNIVYISDKFDKRMDAIRDLEYAL